MKKTISAVLAALGIAAAAPASAVTVGGINFGVGGASFHIETATIAASFVNNVGDMTTSYGLITSVNGNTNYCAGGGNNCALYFRTDATVSNAGPGAGPDIRELYLAGTRVTVFYSGAAAIDLFSQSSAANLTYLAGLTQWATFKGENGVDFTGAGLAADTHITQTVTGLGTVSATGSGLISVDLGDLVGDGAVEAYLNANTIPTFNGTFADIAITESGNNFVLNPFDIANGSADSCGRSPLLGGPDVGDWCIQGTADLRGRTVYVPEPASLALLGLGLLGLGAARRAKRS